MGAEAGAGASAGLQAASFLDASGTRRRLPGSSCSHAPPPRAPQSWLSPKQRCPPVPGAPASGLRAAFPPCSLLADTRTRRDTAWGRETRAEEAGPRTRMTPGPDVGWQEARVPMAGMTEAERKGGLSGRCAWEPGEGPGLQGRGTGGGGGGGSRASWEPGGAASLVSGAGARAEGVLLGQFGSGRHQLCPVTGTTSGPPAETAERPGPLTAPRRRPCGRNSPPNRPLRSPFTWGRSLRARRRQPLPVRTESLLFLNI